MPIVLILSKLGSMTKAALVLGAAVGLMALAKEINKATRDWVITEMGYDPWKI